MIQVTIVTALYFLVTDFAILLQGNKNHPIDGLFSRTTCVIHYGRVKPSGFK